MRVLVRIGANSSKVKASGPLPRAYGSLFIFCDGDGGLKTRQCFAPCVCTTNTSCLSVCGGAETFILHMHAYVVCIHMR